MRHHLVAMLHMHVGVGSNEQAQRHVHDHHPLTVLYGRCMGVGLSEQVRKKSGKATITIQSPAQGVHMRVGWI
jgi:hypothetical protein